MTVIEQERVSAPPKEREDAREERERKASVLEAAALEIEMRGWCQGVRESGCSGEMGHVCLVGAVGYAVADTPWMEGGYQHTAHLFGLRDDSLAPADWNDFFAQSADEATFLLRWRAEEIRDGR